MFVTSSSSSIITAKSASLQAKVFNIGNIISMLPGSVLAPVIMLAPPQGVTLIIMFVFMVVPPILWFGLSMMIYALVRHHPNPRVGYYTQQAAYRFYGLFGMIIPVGTFYGTDWRLWIITGGVISFILIPWSMLDLWKIKQEQWHDVLLAEHKSK